MTFEEYINNPQGKGASNLPARNMYEQYYTQELDKLLLKVNGKIEYSLYNNHDRYFIKFRFPHHTYPDFFYDVVIELYNEDKSLSVLMDLKKYQVRFYSNDPSFTFTWAYAFNKNGLLIKELRNKCSRVSLTTPPVVRNPSESTGYCKYLYYAYLLTKLYNLFDKGMYLPTKIKPFGSLTSGIPSADDKYQERQKAQKEYAKFTKEKKENLSHQDNTNTPDNTSPDKLIKLTPKVKNTRVIGSSSFNTTRITPKTKRSKRI